jgi:cysteine-rich repeat protein
VPARRAAPAIARRRLAPSLLALGLVAACASEPVAGVGVRLDDPLALFDRIDGRRLRVLVLPAETHACAPGTGLVTPEPPRDPANAMVPEAIVDVPVEFGAGAARVRAEIQVPAGRYTILVRGRGIDRVSMEPDKVIASGCATAAVDEGATQGVQVTLREVTSTGTCGNAIVSPDEQCDDGNTSNGDGCSATCRTEPYAINTTQEGTQRLPAVAWGSGAGEGGRAVVLFESEPAPSTIRGRFLDDRGAPLPPGAPDLSIDLLVDAQRPFALGEAAAAAGGGVVTVAYRDYRGPPNFDVRVKRFRLAVPADLTTLTSTLPTESAPATMPGPASAGEQGPPAVAALPDGRALVVFTHMGALGARLFAAPTPGNPPPTVGEGAGAVMLGTAGATAPSVAAVGAAFLVIYLQGGMAFAQRVDATTGAGDAPMALGPAPLGARTAIAALPTCPASGGCALAAWEADGNVSARLLTAEGMPLGAAPIAVPSSSGSGRAAPAVAAGASRFLVVWQEPAGLRARVFHTDGTPAVNRERPPTSDEFDVAGPGATDPRAAAGGRDGAVLVVWSDPARDAAGGISARLLPLP